MINTWQNEIKLFIHWKDKPELFYKIIQQGNSNNLFILSPHDNNDENISLLKAIIEKGLKENYNNQSVIIWKKNTIPIDFILNAVQENIFIFGNFLFPNKEKFITFNHKKIFILYSLKLINGNINAKKQVWNLIKKYYLK